MTAIEATPAPADGPPAWPDLIVRTPGVCGGQARVAGTRIKVKHIYRWVEEGGRTPAQVVADYPHLTRAQVHAALAYFWAHEAEVRADIAAEDELVTRLRAAAGPSKYEAALAETDAAGAPLPPG